MKACFRPPATDDGGGPAAAAAERAAAMAALADGFEATVRDLHAANHALRTRVAAVDELATAAVGQVRGSPLPPLCRCFLMLVLRSPPRGTGACCWVRLWEQHITVLIKHGTHVPSWLSSKSLQFDSGFLFMYSSMYTCCFSTFDEDHNSRGLSAAPTPDVARLGLKQTDQNHLECPPRDELA